MVYAFECSGMTSVPRLRIEFSGFDAGPVNSHCTTEQKNHRIQLLRYRSKLRYATRNLFDRMRCSTEVAKIPCQPDCQLWYGILVFVPGHPPNRTVSRGSGRHSQPCLRTSPNSTAKPRLEADIFSAIRVAPRGKLLKTYLPLWKAIST